MNALLQTLYKAMRAIFKRQYNFDAAIDVSDTHSQIINPVRKNKSAAFL